jgi:hypothetical protein
MAVVQLYNLWRLISKNGDLSRELYQALFEHTASLLRAGIQLSSIQVSSLDLGLCRNGAMGLDGEAGRFADINTTAQEIISQSKLKYDPILVPSQKLLRLTDIILSQAPLPLQQLHAYSIGYIQLELNMQGHPATPHGLYLTTDTLPPTTIAHIQHTLHLIRA